MKKNIRFLIRISREDQKTIRYIARKLNRSMSDAVRWSINETAIMLRDDPDRLQLINQVKRPPKVSGLAAWFSRLIGGGL